MLTCTFLQLYNYLFPLKINNKVFRNDSNNLMTHNNIQVAQFVQQANNHKYTPVTPPALFINLLSTKVTDH